MFEKYMEWGENRLCRKILKKTFFIFFYLGLKKCCSQNYLDNIFHKVMLK